MKKIKKTIKNTMVWATESDFRLFAVVCEVCAVFFTVWACCSEVCFFWQEIVGLHHDPERRRVFAGAADDGRRIV